MITSIDNDGRQMGFDESLVEAVTKRVNIPVIASGGAGSSNDIVELCKNTNCDAIAVATLIHYGIENIIDIKANLKRNNIGVRL